MARPEHSTIFVAFDKRHDGSVGSRRFITHFLEPHVRRKYKCKIQVASMHSNVVLNMHNLIEPGRVQPGVSHQVFLR